jgi:hypothetical protein
MKILENKKIGFLLNDLSHNQLNFSLFNNANYSDKYDINIFHKHYTYPCIPVNGGIFNISKVYCYNGPLIATNLETAAILLNCPSPVKYFYVWDLEWLRMRQKNYHILKNLYKNNDLIYITRNKDYKDLIENCWDTKVEFIIENADFFNNKEFIDYVEKKRISINDRR